MKKKLLSIAALSAITTLPNNMTNARYLKQNHDTKTQITENKKKTDSIVSKVVDINK